jgi:predicted protein tyrosine phosphatase
MIPPSSIVEAERDSAADTGYVKRFDAMLSVSMSRGYMGIMEVKHAAATPKKKDSQVNQSLIVCLDFLNDIAFIEDLLQFDIFFIKYCIDR